MTARPGSRSWGVLVLAAVAMVAGCGRAPVCPETYFPGEISIPATSTTITPLLERFSANTTRPDGRVAVAIVDNTGTIAFEGRGPVSAFIYDQSPWSDIGSTLYAGLGVEDGTWYPFWLYCSPDGRLTNFYGEMTDRDLGVLEPVEGRCERTGEQVDMAIELPAQRLRNVALTCGVAMTAPAFARQIDLGGSRAGSMDFSGASATVLPFHTVDCRNGCGSSTGGWYELHAIVWDSAASQLGFGIFYLDGGSAGTGTTLARGLLLPPAVPLLESFPNAVWTLDR